jgi:hypothetical protein
MITTSVLYTGGKHYSEKHGRGLTIHDQRGAADLINDVSLNVVDHVAKIGAKANMLVRDRDGDIAMNPEFLDEVFGRFGYGDMELIDSDITITSSREVRSYFIRRLVEEARLRLVLCGSDSVKYHHLVGWLIFLLFDLNGWLEQLEEVVGEAGRHSAG